MKYCFNGYNSGCIQYLAQTDQSTIKEWIKVFPMPLLWYLKDADFYPHQWVFFENGERYRIL